MKNLELITQLLKEISDSGNRYSLEYTKDGDLYKYEVRKNGVTGLSRMFQHNPVDENKYPEFDNAAHLEDTKEFCIRELLFDLVDISTKKAIEYFKNKKTENL